MQDFDNPGLFYLGRQYDLTADRALEMPVLYDSRDLVTQRVTLLPKRGPVTVQFVALGWDPQ